MPSPRVIISGGGTGGHIFPAIAIANAIKQIHPDAEFLFVGAKGRMEMEKVPQAGYKIEGLWISGLQRSLTAKNLSFPFKLISSIWNARKIIKKFKPDLAIGVGGYASGPLLYVASNKGVKTLIQEQNSYPGITNKLLAKKVDRICVAYENMERWFPQSKIEITGNPVRENIIDIADKKEKAQAFFQTKSDKVLLVIGGSLGARTINRVIENNIENFIKNGITVIWQTGKSYFEQAKSAVNTTQAEHIKVHEFIYDMDLAYAIADVVVSRAGAMSISELSLIHKPTILVPSPNVAEDHQTKNAMALVNQDAAILVKDAEANEKLFPEIKQTFEDETLQKTLVTNITAMGKTNAAQHIAQLALSLIEK